MRHAWRALRLNLWHWVKDYPTTAAILFYATMLITGAILWPMIRGCVPGDSAVARPRSQPHAGIDETMGGCGNGTAYNESSINTRSAAQHPWGPGDAPDLRAPARIGTPRRSDSAQPPISFASSLPGGATAPAVARKPQASSLKPAISGARRSTTRRRRRTTRPPVSVRSMPITVRADGMASDITSSSPRMGLSFRADRSTARAPTSRARTRGTWGSPSSAPTRTGSRRRRPSHPSGVCSPLAQSSRLRRPGDSARRRSISTAISRRRNARGRGTRACFFERTVGDGGRDDAGTN